jgi:hypothetical protein
MEVRYSHFMVKQAQAYDPWQKILFKLDRLERRITGLEGKLLGAMRPALSGHKVYNDSADPPRLHKSTRSMVRKG